MGRVRNKDTLFGKRLKELCRRNDLTQEGLSIKMNCSIDTVKNWYQGFNVPKWGELCRLCDLLGCSADYLLGREELPQHEASVIHDITGLSEKAIDILREEHSFSVGEHLEAEIKAGITKIEHPKTDFINAILESEEISDISPYVIRLKQIKGKDKIPYNSMVKQILKGRTLFPKEEKDYYAQQLGFAIQKIFSE